MTGGLADEALDAKASARLCMAGGELGDRDPALDAAIATAAPYGGVADLTNAAQRNQAREALPGQVFKGAHRNVPLAIHLTPSADLRRGLSDKIVARWGDSAVIKAEGDGDRPVKCYGKGPPAPSSMEDLATELCACFRLFIFMTLVNVFRLPTSSAGPIAP